MTLRISAILTIILILSACGTTPSQLLYQNEYIILDKTDAGYSINGNVVSIDQQDSLAEILGTYPVKKVLLRSENGPSMGELFNIAPILSSAGYRLFFLKADGELQEMSWVAP